MSKWQNIIGESEDDLVSLILTHLNRSLTGIQCKRQFQPKDVLTADWSALRAEDFSAMQYALRCGCYLLATVHAGSLEELFQKPGWDKCRDEQLFGRYVVISKEDGKRRYQVKTADEIYRKWD